MMHILFRLGMIAALAGAALAALGFAGARADPVVRRADVALPGWPPGAPPIDVVLLSDVHMGNAVMDPARLERIVAQANGLDADLILIGGDFIAGHEPAAAREEAPRLVTPLSRLRARLGVLAVLGNHDHWTGADAVRLALSAAEVTILDNRATRRGPVTIVGIGDTHTRHADAGAALASAAGQGGALVVLSHGPDIVPTLPRLPALALVGHTHCGQVALPIVGAPLIPSNYGSRYACGIVREGGRATIITAGVGTSMLPFRLGAPPDMWLLTLHG